MKLLFLLSLAIGLSTSALAEKRPQEANILLKFIQTEDAAKVLNQIFPKELTLEKNEDKQSLRIQAEEITTLAKAMTLLAQLDSPTQNIPCSWFQLTYLDAELATKMIRKAKPQTDGLHLTPDPRTNRIFFIGTKEDKEWVAKWIKEADTKMK